MKNSTQVTVNKKNVFLALSFLLFLGFVVVFFFVKQNFFHTTQKSPSKVSPQNEIQTLLEKINALYDLPTSEIPTVATVSDKTKLQKQSFFAKAENGDKVLIYTNAKKAILYRPSKNRIMEIAPLSLATDSPTPAPVTKALTVSIYNGSQVEGLAANAEKQLIAKYQTNITVQEKMNSIKEYSHTVIIDVTGKNTKLSQEIAVLLGGTVTQLQTGERAPKGEILVIMGK